MTFEHSCLEAVHDQRLIDLEGGVPEASRCLHGKACEQFVGGLTSSPPCLNPVKPY